jgi:hypothetical protein
MLVVVVMVMMMEGHAAVVVGWPQKRPYQACWATDGRESIAAMLRQESV